MVSGNGFISRHVGPLEAGSLSEWGPKATHFPLNLDQASCELAPQELGGAEVGSQDE